jgi:hypothetical protein
MKHVLGLFIVVAFTLTGCATYIPPGAKADLQVFAPPSIQEGFAAKPVAPFPVAIAAVRVQAPTYSNYYLRTNGGVFGTGRYSIITAHEVEEQSQFDRLSKLPQVAGIISINRMLLPQRLDSDKEIREGASRLQADMVFLYTFDTSFFDTDISRPLTVITLGLSPTRKISATTTASALLMDTRTGYVYAAYEATARMETLATSWGSSDTADEGRRRNEKEAFGNLIEQVVSGWPRLLERYSKPG